MFRFLVLITYISNSVFGYTVSGISSGAYFASQHHVAFSASVTGAGVIAGGPYFCSEGSIENAQNACRYTPSLISLATCEKYAEAASSKGTIDNLSNLQFASVYIFAGTLDTAVNQGAGKAAFEFYKKYVTNGTIVTNFVTPAEHS